MSVKPKTQGLPPAISANDRSNLIVLIDEYIRDFDIKKAGQRCGLSGQYREKLFNSPWFTLVLREALEFGNPEKIMSKGEILLKLKEIAYTSPRDCDKINALKEISKLLMYGENDGEGDSKKIKNITPVVNLTLTTEK